MLVLVTSLDGRYIYRGRKYHDKRYYCCFGTKENTVRNNSALWLLIILTLIYSDRRDNRTCWNFVVGISSQENIAAKNDIILSNNQACESQRNKKHQALRGSLTFSCCRNYLLGLESFRRMIRCPRKHCDTQSFCQFLSGGNVTLYDNQV